MPLAKPGSLFALPEHVESYAVGVLSDLADERHLRGLSRESFVERLTHYYAELNAVHPFREGNGRAQRAFMRQLALDADHSLSWEMLDQAELVSASKESFKGNSLPLHKLIDRAADRPERSSSSSSETD